MKHIDINDAAQRAGAVYFVVGRGTEGGPASYRLSVAGVGPQEWGTVSAVAANSGYSLGSIQVDLGQRGTWPLGAVNGRSLLPGETTYVDAVITQTSAYARTHQLPFPDDRAGLAELRSDLLSHGNGQRNRPSIRFISAEHRDTFNAWAGSDAGKQWIHRNIDFPQVQAVADAAKEVIDQHGQHIPEQRRFEVLCILAKNANQHPASYRELVGSLKGGADYERFMNKVAELNGSVPNYDADKAGELARQYQENFQKPGNALAMEAAHRQVASDRYRPSEERHIPEIQTALAAYRRDVNDPSVLDRGDQGNDVRLLQQALQRNGKSLKDDSDFGAGTERLLTEFQRENRLAPTGFGDHPTLQALGIAPALDATSSASLQRMVDGLRTDGRFSGDQIDRIAESSQNYLLEHRAALGEVTHAQLRNDGQKILFQNGFSQMRELDTRQALDGYLPARPLVEAPAASSPVAERTAEAMRQ